MRIACLQFAPQVGDVDNNLNRADAVLSKANPQDIDLMVLPELAFSGYNFRSLQHITPFLEPTAAGISSLWARTTALKYDCIVTVGYPEKVDVTAKWPTSPEYYNSAITVNSDGETIANYRKSFLYYTDETWALEGPDGFYSGQVEGLGNVAMGICMDLNPYKFEAPWSAWEFAYHILHMQANLVVLSMAWLTREDARTYSREPNEPDMETLSYWLSRLEPLIRAESVGEIIIVLANRTGVEEEAVYAGTSAVLGIQAGEVKVYGILGRGEKELLIVDTDKQPEAKLVSEPNSAASHASLPTTPSTATGDSRDTASTADTNLTDSHPTNTHLTDTNATESNLTESNLAEVTTPRTLFPDTTGLGVSNADFEGHQDEYTAIISPDVYFSPYDGLALFTPAPCHPEAAGLCESMQSFLGHDLSDKPVADSPILKQLDTRKGLDTSRSHSGEKKEPTTISHHIEERFEANCTETPTSVPRSASASLDGYQTSFTESSLGPRSSHTLHRAKSAFW